MTPKEKAEELYESYLDIMPQLHKQTGMVIKNHAANCAKIAVDEVMKELINIEFNYDLDFHSDLLPYWNEVKTELLKL